MFLLHGVTSITQKYPIYFVVSSRFRPLV
uniref:Uncharacterized protein n=1 Tax=Lepeophtheirus salmonis TaxID=72036 RepID=A0A0K2TRS7_LEPSM